MSVRKYAIPFALAAALLSACGGGGSREVLIEINSDNARLVVAAVFGNQSVFGLLGDSLADSFDSDAGAAGASPSASLKGVFGLAVDPVVNPAIAFGPVVEPCATGGTLTVSGNVASPVTLAAGDRIEIIFNECIEEDELIINGRMVLRVQSFLGSALSGSFRLGYEMTLTNLRFTLGSQTDSLDGRLSGVLDTRSSPLIISEISGSKVTAQTGNSTWKLTDFVFDESYHEISGAYSMAISGSLSGALIGGRADFLTVAPFTGSGDMNPSSGEMLITGADNASIRVILLDTTNLRLELDLDGNGSVDEVDDLTWDDLVL